MELHELIEHVSDEDSFLKFAEALRLDRANAETIEKQKPNNPSGPDSGGWENTSIESFLESAIAWASDTKFGIRQGDSRNSWKLFAYFLYAGKHYE